MTFLRTHRSAHHIALAVGLGAATLVSLPDLDWRLALGLQAALWVCLLLFALAFIRSLTMVLQGDRTAAQLTEVAVDGIAALPVPIALAAGVEYRTAWLLAYLWVFTLHRFSSGLAMLARVIRHEAKALSGVLVLFLIVLFLGAGGMHLAERDLQPTSFGSMPLSLWWAITTLTTTGYGDVVPVSVVGRMIAGVVMVSGIGVVALWAGILATGFAAESRREDLLRTWDLVASVPFFQELGPGVIAELTGHLRRWEVRSAATVVRRGLPGDSMYFIARGEVEVRLPDRKVRLGEGAFFGEMALLTGAPRSADVVATRQTTLLVLDAVDFRQLTSRLPALADAIRNEAQRRRDASAASAAAAGPPASPR